MVAPTTLLGAAGEHYVMSLLLRHGFIAALAPVGVPNCDIVVTDDIGDRLCAIQVKTRVDKGSDGGWHMSRKHEGISSPRLFYTFLDFGKSLIDPPTCYVVPSAIVADAVARSHAQWLSQPGKRGQVRKDSELRRFMPDYSKVGVDTHSQSANNHRSSPEAGALARADAGAEHFLHLRNPALPNLSEG